MKQRILMMALLLTIGFNSTFANTEKGVSEVIEKAFKADFSNATEVEWETVRDYAKATFKLNNQVMFAYYSKEGNFIAATRNLLTSQLPIQLMNDLKKNYSGMWVSDLFEMSSPVEMHYYATMEDADSKIVLKSSGAGNWVVFKKEKKN